LRLDSKRLTRLTNNEFDDVGPMWSPDGKRIAFQGKRQDDVFHIFVMDTDGKNIVQLTSHESNDYIRAWTPNSKSIIFKRGSSPADLSSNLHIVSVNGGNVEKISNMTYADNPSLNRGDKKIIFSGILESVSNKQQIFSADLDGGNLKNLSANSHYDTNPVLSPKGNKILFLSDRDAGYYLYLMDVNGKNQKLLASDSSCQIAEKPSWSHDGKKLQLIIHVLDTWNFAQ
jgi:TolB protein